jgi:hypothetical protein
VGCLKEEGPSHSTYASDGKVYTNCYCYAHLIRLIHVLQRTAFYCSAIHRTLPSKKLFFPCISLHVYNIEKCFK